MKKKERKKEKEKNIQKKKIVHQLVIKIISFRSFHYIIGFITTLY